MRNRRATTDFRGVIYGSVACETDEFGAFAFCMLKEGSEDSKSR